MQIYDQPPNDSYIVSSIGIVGAWPHTNFEGPFTCCPHALYSYRLALDMVQGCSPPLQYLFIYLFFSNFITDSKQWLQVCRSMNVNPSLSSIIISSFGWKRSGSHTQMSNTEVDSSHCTKLFFSIQRFKHHRWCIPQLCGMRSASPAISLVDINLYISLKMTGEYRMFKLCTYVVYAGYIPVTSDLKQGCQVCQGFAHARPTCRGSLLGVNYNDNACRPQHLRFVVDSKQVITAIYVTFEHLLYRVIFAVSVIS